MSAIDHAAVRMETPTAPSRGAWPAVARAALAFAVLWLPLTALALVTGWRGSWATPDDYGALLADYVRYGSAVSGPLAPQLVLVGLALAARRASRLALVATGAIGVVGLLIVVNGAGSALTDHEHAPQVAGVLAGIGFLTYGVALVALSARRLAASFRRTP